LAAGVAAALPLNAGCETTIAADPSLALACQTTSCECVSAVQRLGRRPATADVLWRPNGDAYCPPDFVLRRKNE
jgi:hypothetical protein